MEQGAGRKLFARVGTKTTAALQQTLKDLEGLSKSGNKSCNPFSLYRRRLADKEEAKHQFGKVRKALADHHWGEFARSEYVNQACGNGL
jgi:hypothetical protein